MSEFKCVCKGKVYTLTGTFTSPPTRREPERVDLYGGTHSFLAQCVDCKKEWVADSKWGLFQIMKKDKVIK